MALLGKSLAIASVGISCQTAHQIETQAPLIRLLAGDALEEHSTPFDWLLCPVKSATKMIAERCFHPGDVSELVGSHKPFWPRMGCHFWHTKFDDPSSFVARGRHVAETWDRIADSERKVFIVSNTQNNITRALLEHDRQPIECRMIWDDVFRLFAALCRQFGQIELHVVTHDPKHLATSAVFMPWDDGRNPITIHTFERDHSSWEGNSYAWQQLFREILK